MPTPSPTPSRPNKTALSPKKKSANSSSTKPTTSSAANPTAAHLGAPPSRRPLQNPAKTHPPRPNPRKGILPLLPFLPLSQSHLLTHPLTHSQLRSRRLTHLLI